jgi:hypothetical protein
MAQSDAKGAEKHQNTHAYDKQYEQLPFFYLLPMLIQFQSFSVTLTSAHLDERSVLDRLECKPCTYLLF